MRKKILMVDDNVLDGELVAEILEEDFSDIHFHLALDGKEALQYLNDCQTSSRRLPQLILLDLNLPGKNGFEILTEIKENKSLCLIPVVIFSSSSAPDDIDTAFCRGANAYLVKSLHYDELVAVLESLVHFWFEISEIPCHSGMQCNYE